MLCLERVENKCSEEDSKRKSGEKIFCLMEREHSLTHCCVAEPRRSRHLLWGIFVWDNRLIAAGYERAQEVYEFIVKYF